MLFPTRGAVLQRPGLSADTWELCRVRRRPSAPRPHRRGAEQGPVALVQGHLVNPRQNWVQGPGLLGWEAGSANRVPQAPSDSPQPPGVLSTPVTYPCSLRSAVLGGNAQGTRGWGFLCGPTPAPRIKSAGSLEVQTVRSV